MDREGRLIEAKIGEELAGTLFANFTGRMDREGSTHILLLFCGLYEKWRFQTDEHIQYSNATFGNIRTKQRKIQKP
jgi:hypothetical protein